MTEKILTALGLWLLAVGIVLSFMFEAAAFTPGDWAGERWTSGYRADIRERAIGKIWKGRDRLPRRLAVHRNGFLRVKLPWGFVSRSPLFFPLRWNGDFMLVHAGHSPSGWHSYQYAVDQYLEAGFAVVGMSMPYAGDNRWPAVVCGLPVEGTGHNNMRCLETDVRSPLELFLTPPVAVVNWIFARYPKAGIHMNGVSGGGWTTSIVCALDPRLELCASIAGDTPLYANDYWEWEYRHGRLNRVMNFLDMYVLGACQNDRIQILHRGDPLFKASAAKSYRKHVRRVVDKCGGSWKIFITDHHIHDYGQVSVDIILERLR